MVSDFFYWRLKLFSGSIFLTSYSAKKIFNKNVNNASLTPPQSG